MKYFLFAFSLIFSFFLMQQCSKQQTQNLKPPSKQFQDYWLKSGKAEMAKYDLQQARYGQLHSGHVVLVFVTEDFDSKKQVKIESKPSQDAVPVLKLNRIKRFTTGIYDYSLMTSIFTPIDTTQWNPTLKITTSIQDWCGHVWMQLNHRGSHFLVKSFSYFQEATDSESELPIELLEDNVWMQIRLNPDVLPVGKQRMIPSSEYTRLLHKDFRFYDATIEKTKYVGNEYRLPKGQINDLIQYKITYPELKREMLIVYEKSFPHLIAGWKSAYKSGWGDRAKTLISSAKLTHVYRSAYWNENHLKDQSLRKKLDLSP